MASRGNEDEPRGLWNYVNGRAVPQEAEKAAQEFTQSYENFQTKINEDITAKNKERLRQRFAEMKKQNNDKLDAMEEKAINAMDKMPVDQQEKLVDFWGGFKSFFTDLMGWIGRAWNRVLEAIKALWTEVRNVVTGIFRGIKKALNIFNPFSW